VVLKPQASELVLPELEQEAQVPALALPFCCTRREGTQEERQRPTLTHRSATNPSLETLCHDQRMQEQESGDRFGAINENKKKIISVNRC
jgi:hypothetical protein